MKQAFSLRSLFTSLFAASLLVFTVSCSDDDDEVVCNPCPDTPVTTVPDSLAGKLVVSFNHTADGQALVLETPNLPYTNSLAQPYKVTKLMYYISNVKLINTQTGKTFAEPNSYHLIDLGANKTSFSFTGIPVKSYDKIEFAIGVDSKANSSTDKKGDLDPDHDMAWDWNTGYKFFVMLGFTSNNKGLVYHIGSNSNYKTLSFPLNQTVNFQKDKPVTANVTVNLNELFRNPNTIDFDTVFNFMGGPGAKMMAENDADDLFNITSISQ